MFERLIVRPQNAFQPNDPVDLGALVEGAIFYGKTELVLDSAAIRQIARRWTTDGLLAFLEAGVVTPRYQTNFAAIHTSNTGTARERHDPVVFDVTPNASATPAPEYLIQRVLEEVTGRPGHARRVTKRVCRLLAVERKDADLAQRVRTDLLDSSFVSPVVLELMHSFVPELQLPAAARFRSIKSRMVFA